MSTVFKNTAQLTFDEYVQNISIRIGMSPSSLHNLWKAPSEEHLARVNAFPNPSKKNVAHLGEIILKTQLHPGEQAEQLWGSVLENMHIRLSWKHLEESPAILPTGKGIVLSLRKLLFSTLVESSTTSFFGQELLSIEPKLLDYFETFDESSWKLSYRVPKSWAKDMLTAKTQVSTALQKYASISADAKSDACWMIRTLESELHDAGLHSHDIGLQLLLLYWV